MDASTTRAIRRWVRDLHLFESHLLEVLGHQRALAVRSTEVAEAIEDLERRVDGSVARIGTRIDEMPAGDGAWLGDSVAGFLGHAVGVVDRMRGTTVARGMRDDRLAFASVVVGYEMLLTTALAVGDVATARMCELALRDYSACVRLVEKVLPLATMEDLEDHPGITVVNAGVTRAVHAAVDRAWSAA